MHGYNFSKARSFPWISVTGVSSLSDAEQLTMAVRKTKNSVPIVCGIGGSYKRLLDSSKRGEHSLSFNELNGIVKKVACDSKSRIVLHYLPKPDGDFYSGCMCYIEEIAKETTLDYLQITKEWPDIKQLECLHKNVPDIDIILQVPLYKLQDLTMDAIGINISRYIDIAPTIALDASGGQGTPHNCAVSKQIIDILVSRQIKANYVLAGGVDWENVDKYILELYRHGHLCAIDAQSKLQTGFQLDGNKVYNYLQSGCNTYSSILSI